MAKHPKRPADMMQLAKTIGEIATSEHAGDKDPGPTKAQQRASAGGRARAAKLPRRKRVAIAKKARRSRKD
jgi:hypothetical protein